MPAIGLRDLIAAGDVTMTQTEDSNRLEAAKNHYLKEPEGHVQMTDKTREERRQLAQAANKELDKKTDRQKSEAAKADAMNAIKGMKW